MTDEPEYIDIADLAPGPGKYPWAEWRRIPPGKCLRITDHKPARSALQFARVLGGQAMRYDLRVILRGDAVYITQREREP